MGIKCIKEKNGGCNNHNRNIVRHIRDMKISH